MKDSDQITLTIAQAKIKIARADAMLRLRKNKDFKKVFTDGYLSEQLKAMVMRKSAPGFQGENEQRYIEGQLSAMSYLNQFIMLTLLEGEQAKAGVENHEAELENALAEEA